MFVVLLECALSQSPVILVPGLYGSNLVGSHGKRFSKHWYCSKQMNNSLFWVNLKYLIPPLHNCFFEMLQAHYNPYTDSIVSDPDIDIDVLDFGGSEGMSYIDKEGLFGYHFVESFGPMLDYFRKRGYIVKKDLFGAPYDWRLAISGLEKSFFPKLKRLIEQAYDLNAYEKVTLVGYSCGGFCIQRFLTKYVDIKWKNKYVKKVILVAPAFAGSGDTLDVAWNRYFPLAPMYQGETVSSTVEASPCVHALFPNHVVFGDTEIIRGPNGQKYFAKDIPQFLIDQKKISGTNIKLMMKNVRISAEAPQEMGVPTFMLYNSGVPTYLSMNFAKGYDKEPERLTVSGDGTVPSKGPEWACNTWKGKTSIICFDLLRNNIRFNHMGIATNPYVFEIIYNATIDDKWTSKVGKKFEFAPHVDINLENDGFIIREDIRPLKIVNK